METAIVFLAKASAIMALFIIAYHVFLKKETFFNSNRGFLLAGLFTAVLLPLLSYTKIIWVAAAAPVARTRAIDMSKLIAAKNALPIVSEPAPETFTINWWYVGLSIYAIGAAFFLIRFIADIIKVRRMLSGQKIAKENGYKFIDSAKAAAPFSFFGYIVYNSSLLQPQDLESIIAHEKVHSRQKHSLDMIIGQLFCIAFWFNPFVWIYKKAISQNLEFIADAEATKQLADKTAYQKTLLKITLQPECIAITNHFYQSLIKKRIVMLNKTQSKKRNGLKYAIVLPALAAFMFVFQYKVIAQEKEPVAKEASYSQINIEITKDTKDAELEKQKKLLKEQFGADVTFSNITRNSKGEITGIKVSVKENGRSAVQETTGSTPIATFSIEVEKDANGTRTAIANGTLRTKPGHPAPPAVPAAPGYVSPAAAPPAPPMPPATHIQGTGYIMNTDDEQVGTPLNFGNSDALVIINGVVQPKATAIVLPVGQQITGVTTLDKKEAKKKYGKDAKKGAVEITTAKSTNGVAINMDEVMGYAQQGMDAGFKVLADIDFDKILGEAFASISFDDLQGLSDEEMKSVQEELKNAQLEIELAGPEIQRQFDAQRLSRDEMLEARKAIMEARKEIMQAKKEIMQAKKDALKAKKEAVKKA